MWKLYGFGKGPLTHQADSRSMYTIMMKYWASLEQTRKMYMTSEEK